MIETAVLKQMMAKHFLAYINEFGCITLNSDLITLNLRNCKQNIVKERKKTVKYKKKPVVIEAFKYDGDLDIMYLQYLLDTFLTMAKEYRRSPK